MRRILRAWDLAKICVLVYSSLEVGFVGSRRDPSQQIVSKTMPEPQGKEPHRASDTAHNVRIRQHERFISARRPRDIVESLGVCHDLVNL
jgi:hypothetical protein